LTTTVANAAKAVTNTLTPSEKEIPMSTDTKNTASVAQALTEGLTDTYRLVLKSHTYHWNVTGPLFYSVHEMTEAHYTDMFAAADVLAERVRALGEPALVSPNGLAAGPDGQELKADLTADAMVKDLQSDHERLAGKMRALVETAEAAEDPATADLATERAAFHEKAAWMLRATAA
jgi:starvation-inducible DNA-binding protein